MRVRSVSSLGLLLAIASTTAAAQGGSIDSQCRAGTLQERVTQDACQKAIDLFTFMAPQLGGALTGGNAISGEHSVIGRPGHASIGLRVNAVKSSLPQVDRITPSVTGAAASNYETKDQVVPVPTIDAALSVLPGVAMGGTTALGVDVLLNVAVLPSVSSGDFSVDLPDSRVKVGFGARVSLVEESVVTPGISFTYIRRDLPRISITGTPSSDEIKVDNFQVKTSAWRGVIGKDVGPVSIAAGFGQDKYETSALAEVTVTRAGISTRAGPIAATQKLTRDNAFGSLALNLPVVSIVVEAGRASGGSLKTYNTFSSTRADDPLTYGSLGLRFHF